MFPAWLLLLLAALWIGNSVVTAVRIRRRGGGWVAAVAWGMVAGVAFFLTGPILGLFDPKDPFRARDEPAR